MGTWIKKRMLPSEYHFLIDGTSSFSYGIRVATTASETVASAKYYDFEDVLGRDGSTTSFMGTYDDRQISFECSFVCDKKKIPQFWYNQWRNIKRWIMETNGQSETHKLQISDDKEWYMNIVNASISECQRTAHEVGSFTITFTVEPFMWAVSGDKWQSIDDVKYNPYFKCYPLWKINNTSTSTKEFTIKLNDEHTFTINNCYTNRTYYIDTELQVTYMTDGAGNIIRAGRSGLEEWASLESGMNTIQVASGFDVTCKPRWRSL